MNIGERELTAAEAADILAVSERHAEALLKARLVAGRQLRSGAWFTNIAAVRRYQATSQRGRGSALRPATAWGMLWELSGRRPSWLATSTLARVRHQLATSSAEEIVRATSGRTRARYYSLPRSTEGISWDGLIRTGRPAARHLGMRNNRKFIYLSGYPEIGTVEHLARQNRLVEDYEGDQVLFENTLPILYTRSVMPAAVVAVDLTLTGGAFERERGIWGIEQLQKAWRETRPSA